jgi:phage shock protein E
MIGVIKALFGGVKHDFKDLIQQGAIVVDVRSEGEYKTGHIAGSVNIPLNKLTNGMKKINSDKTVITCCASGVRSASAKNILLSNGFKNVVNGGGWRSLNSRLK